jgi:glutathione peroxidase
VSAIYDIALTRANGEEIKLSHYEGSVLLIVNVASKCGLTPQYEGLEQLYRQYKDQGLRVLGFPCNDFAGQEPGTMEEIQQFCSVNYGVSFELFRKIAVLGENKHPLYEYLTQQTEPEGDIKWNFEKFVIGKSGEIVGRFSPKMQPNDPEITGAIEKSL